jgi:lauroyl/myristoyl acyltransferase
MAMYYVIQSLVKCLPSVSKFFQMSFNVFLTRHLPFWASRWYLGLVGKIYYALNRQQKRSIEDAVKQVFQGQVSGQEMKSRLKKTFAGIFEHYHEKLLIAYPSPQKVERYLRKNCRLQGETALQAAQEVGKGVILVTGHFGAVEFLPAILGLNGYPASIIYRPQTEYLANSLAERAKLINLTLINAHDGNVFKAAINALKEGRILITECDEFEEYRPDPNKKLSFLGQKIDSDKTLDILSKRAGAPVLSALVRRQEGGYTLNLQAVNGGSQAVENGVGGRCLKILEEAVETSPDQWYQWKEFAKVIAAHSEEIIHETDTGEALAPEAAFSAAF